MTALVAGDQRAQMLLGDVVFLVPLVAAATLACSPRPAADGVYRPGRSNGDGVRSRRRAWWR